MVSTLLEVERGLTMVATVVSQSSMPRLGTTGLLWTELLMGSSNEMY
jgi:hypothetical protein